MASSNPLAAASAALSKAKNFTKSVEGKEPSMFAPKPPAAPAAPKSTAKSSGGMAQTEKDASDIVSGINWRLKQQRDLPKYHKGGKIKKDGVQTINAEKGETVLPNQDKDKAVKLAMDHLHGMKEGLSAGKKKKSEAKSEHKHEAPKHEKRHGKVHHVGVKKVDDGSFVMTNQHHPMEDGSNIADTMHTSPDMDGVIEHMQEHMGTPNPGEAEAEAPAAPAAGAGPAAA